MGELGNDHTSHVLFFNEVGQTDFDWTVKCDMVRLSVVGEEDALQAYRAFGTDMHCLPDMWVYPQRLATEKQCILSVLLTLQS